MAVSRLAFFSTGAKADVSVGTFFTRYDYENVDSTGAQGLVDGFAAKVANKSFIGSTVSGRKVTDAGNFGYIDPVDGSVSKNQGLFARFDDGSRIVVRLSGTGSSGATIRLYLEMHESVKSSSSTPPDLERCSDDIRVTGREQTQP